MANLIDQIAKGPDSAIQFFDDGSIVFAPNPEPGNLQKVGIIGFFDLAGRGAPALSPAGSARLYFDSGSDTVQVSQNAGAYQTLATGVTSNAITNGGGSVTVNADGSITVIALAAGMGITGAVNITGTLTQTGNISLVGATTISSTAGDITINPASGEVTIASNLLLTASMVNTLAGNLTLDANAGVVIVPTSTQLAGGINSTSVININGSSRTGGANTNGDVFLNKLAGTPTVARGRVAIGAAGFIDHADQLHIQGVDSTNAHITIDTYNTGAIDPGIINRRADGTVGTPAALASGDVIGAFQGVGFGTSFLTTNDAEIQIVAAEAFSGTNHGTQIKWFTTPTGGSLVEAVQMTLDSQAGLTLTIPLKPGSGGVAQSTPGLASFIFPGPTGSQTTASVTANNAVNVYLILIPAQITVASLNANIVTAVAASKGAIGIYSVAGNKLVDSGALSTAASSSEITATGLNVSLSPGWYWLAFTDTSTVVTWVGVAIWQVAAGGFLNTTITTSGTAANASAAGVLPATLGAVSAAASSTWPIIKIGA